MRRILFASSLVATAVACGPKEPVAQPSRPAQVVNATVLTNGCQELGRSNAKLAEDAMYKLVEACTSVPGGTAQFAATLQPGGKIDIESVPGQPDVVPVCILKHSLVHKVALAKPCRLDVKMEQRTVDLQASADAGAK